jgi:hypothetical protein
MENKILYLYQTRMFGKVGSNAKRYFGNVKKGAKYFGSIKNQRKLAGFAGDALHNTSNAIQYASNAAGVVAKIPGAHPEYAAISNYGTKISKNLKNVGETAKKFSSSFEK